MGWLAVGCVVLVGRLEGWLEGWSMGGRSTVQYGMVLEVAVGRLGG